jgi:signal transduction histidine kinase
MGEQRVVGRMIANIVDNALIHTPGGTNVVVRVDAKGPRVIISDDGMGVPEAARSRLFERFFRLDASRSTPGSGLGLALAAATAQAFGGRLSAEDAAPGLRIVADFAGH